MPELDDDKLLARLEAIRVEMKDVSQTGLRFPGGAGFSYRLRELEEEAEAIRAQLGIETDDLPHRRRRPPVWALTLGLVSLITIAEVVLTALL
jgi:hypothetical protein